MHQQPQHAHFVITAAGKGVLRLNEGRLEGADDQLYDTHHFYKHPEDYAEFLKELNSKGDHRIRVELVLTDYGHHDDALLIVEEDIADLGDKTIVRYHLCNGWSHKYYKCRADLAACIAMTLNQRVYLRGFWKQGPINVFCEGKGFITDLYSLPYACRRDWLLRKRYAKADWHPDHWVYDPEDYLDGVDEGDWGKKARCKDGCTISTKAYWKPAITGNMPPKISRLIYKTILSFSRYFKLCLDHLNGNYI